MENKNKNTGLVIFLIILLLVFVCFSVLLFTGVIKSPMIKEETKITEKNNTKVDDKTKNENNIVEDESKIIYSGDLLNVDKDFGKVTFNKKEFSIKYSNSDGPYDEGRLYVGDKYIDVLSGSINNIAIMGNYLVIGINQDGYRFELYNSNLEKVEKIGNSLGVLDSNVKANTEKWIIDTNNLIYYECRADYDSRNSDVLDLYNLKIDGSKIEKVLMSSTPGVACTSQR